jgi:hypothetical protein
MSITARDRRFVEGCLEAAYEAHTLLPFVPRDMRLGPPDAEGWADWKMLPSRVTEADIRALEKRLPAPLPPAFVAYLTARHVLAMNFGEYSLPVLPTRAPLRDARNFLMARELWPCGYLQFAGGPCGDPVCFDIARRRPNGDYPVVVFNHDQVPEEAWGSRAALRPYVQQLAPSFRAFLKGLVEGLYEEEPL